MKPDWRKSPNQDRWTAQLGPYTGSVSRTLSGLYLYTVADSTRVLRSGSVGTPQVARMLAEDAAKSLADAS